MPRGHNRRAPLDARIASARRMASEAEAEKTKLSHGLPHLFGFKWYTWAKAFFDSTNPMNLLCAANQISKALDDDTEIPTPRGYVRMGDLRVGDEVYSSEGQPTKVIGVPFKGDAECFRVTFDDGTSVTASDEHRWVCKTSKERFRREYTPGERSKKDGWANPDFDTWTELSTAEVAAVGGYAPEAPSPWRRVSVPMTLPLMRPEAELLDPYLVGLLIGDGGLTGRSVILTTADDEIRDYVMAEHGAVPSGKYGYRLNGYRKALSAIGLMGCGSLSKHIPRRYLEGSADQRLALLRGLMDSDGTVSESAVSFTTISEALRDDFVELVTSLGGKAKVKRRKAGYRDKNGDYVPCNDSYTVRINIIECPFKLARKARKFFVSFRRHERVIYKIENVGRRAATCITVDAVSGTFLCTRDHIVTHNSSTQHRKMIHWATAVKEWPRIWPKKRPRMFWLIYPDRDVATVEWYEKIEPEFMPRGEFKNHPVYGWNVEFEKKQIKAIHFNSGVSIYVKSYSQDVHSLQSGTVDAIFCFPAGTLVLTPTGPRPIEEIREGDVVLAADGSAQAVRKVFSRVAEVITRRFSNGEEVTATPDHPFYTANRGWVSFGNLTSEDLCSTVHGWKLIKSLWCFKERSSLVARRVKTNVSAIISATAARATYMLSFGRPCIAGASQKATSYTTRMETRSTTDRAISSSFQDPSTRDSTRKRSGAQKGTGSLTASDVGAGSSREAPSGRSHAFARKNAGVLLRCASASVARLLLKLAQTSRPCSVLDSAPTAESRTCALVYNLDVGGPHTYFAQGLRVHNCDEELPEELYDELKARLFASDGYFHMVFTATRGALMWLRAIEGKGEDELFPDAFKQQVTMYDCMYYADGSEGAYTKEKIKKIIGDCRSEVEVLRRVMGRFVKETGRLCDQFDPLRHFVKPFKIPSDWHVFSGIDNGSGGDAHPGAYWFLAVKPDYREAYFTDGWRGDDEITTAGDIMQKWEIQCAHRRPVQTAYDWAAKDLATMAERMGIPVVKAEKSHDIGWDILNTLFKFNILRVFDTPEGRKFGSEALTVMKETPKRRRKDDLLDAGRYAACSVPWDWTVVQGLEAEEVTSAKTKNRPWTQEDQDEADIRARRGESRPGDEAEEGWGELTADIEFWNDEYG